MASTLAVCTNDFGVIANKYIGSGTWGNLFNSRIDDLRPPMLAATMFGRDTDPEAPIEQEQIREYNGQFMNSGISAPFVVRPENICSITIRDSETHEPLKYINFYGYFDTSITTIGGYYYARVVTTIAMKIQSVPTNYDAPDEYAVTGRASGSYYTRVSSIYDTPRKPQLVAIRWTMGEDDDLYFGLGLGGREELYDRISPWEAIGFNVSELRRQYGDACLDISDYDPNYGDQSTTGGYTGGTHDNTSDIIGIPPMPTLGVTSTGFINLYNPSLNDLDGFGDFIFPDPGSANDVVTAIIKLCQTMSNSRLIDYVLDCHIIPVEPTVGGNVAIKVGYRTATDIFADKVVSDYVDFDCGSLSLHEYFENFADYLYTNSRLFLPFVGFVDLKPEFWQSGTIGVTYRFNVVDGSFMAYVVSTSSKSQLRDTVIAQYGGNACVHIPITGLCYANLAASVIAAGASLSTGGEKGAAGIESSLETIMSHAASVEQSNPYNSNSAFLSVRVPFLMIERPCPSFSELYPHDCGLPSNVAKVINDLEGFATISDIDLSDLIASDEEKTALRNILSQGIFIKGHAN